VKNGPVASLDSRFRPDLSFHPSGEPMSTPAPREALGESEGNKSAGFVEESPRAPDGPDLSARREIVILIASSSTRCKNLPSISRRPDV
jgi:hypothetical protein